jgi:hypothetical protein
MSEVKSCILGILHFFCRGGDELKPNGHTDNILPGFGKGNILCVHAVNSYGGAEV